MRSHLVMQSHLTLTRAASLATRAASLAAVFCLCGASCAIGQEPPLPPASTAMTEGVPLGSTLSADLFSALPNGDSLFSLLETSQARNLFAHALARFLTAANSCWPNTWSTRLVKS